MRRAWCSGIRAATRSIISLRLDIDRAARAQASPDEEGTERWKKNNLGFDMKSGVGAAVASVAPILAVPGLNLVSKLFH
jgi:hypothetical protein